jgi:hypothetical protein
MFVCPTEGMSQYFSCQEESSLLAIRTFLIVSKSKTLPKQFAVLEENVASFLLLYCPLNGLIFLKK